MAPARAELVRRTIDPSALAAEVAHHSRGAVCSFVGTVRSLSGERRVSELQYECYEPMALRELEAIICEAQRQFGGPAVVVEHRLGTLAVGDVAVAVVTAHERRGSAIGAMQQVIEELKRRLPIWKLERFADGGRRWVNSGTGSEQPASAVEGTA